MNAKVNMAEPDVSGQVSGPSINCRHSLEGLNLLMVDERLRAAVGRNGRAYNPGAPDDRLAEHDVRPHLDALVNGHWLASAPMVLCRRLGVHK